MRSFPPIPKLNYLSIVNHEEEDPLDLLQEFQPIQFQLLFPRLKEVSLVIGQYQTTPCVRRSQTNDEFNNFTPDPLFSCKTVSKLTIDMDICPTKM